MGMSSGQPIVDCWEILDFVLGWKISAGSQVGNLEGSLVRSCQLDPIGGIQPDFSLEIVKSHPTRIIRRSFFGQIRR